MRIPARNSMSSNNKYQTNGIPSKNIYTDNEWIVELSMNESFLLLSPFLFRLEWVRNFCIFYWLFSMKHFIVVTCWSYGCTHLNNNCFLILCADIDADFLHLHHNVNEKVSIYFLLAPRQCRRERLCQFCIKSKSMHFEQHKVKRF